MELIKDVTIGVEYSGAGLFRAYAYTEHGNRASAKAQTAVDALELLFTTLRDDAKAQLELDKEMR